MFQKETHAQYKGLLMFVHYEMPIDMQICHIHNLTSQQPERIQNPPKACSHRLFFCFLNSIVNALIWGWGCNLFAAFKTYSKFVTFLTLSAVIETLLFDFYHILSNR